VIYILALEHDKYYVGRTLDLDRRILEHKGESGKYSGSAWTSKYKYVSLMKTYDWVSNFDEDYYTKRMMSDYGIDNVRGGSYVTINLDDSTKIHLLREMNGANNTCFNCSGDHFVKHCPLSAKKPIECLRCGRNNHNLENCYASSFWSTWKLK
jgi:hypothetical protein